MNVVDSSGWLEFLANGPNADHFAVPLSQPEKLVVPTISLYEVFKRVLMLRGESAALDAAALMHQGQLVDLDSHLSLVAAKFSADRKLPMADSIIWATSQAHDATLWTQDADFQGLPNVRFFPAS